MKRLSALLVTAALAAGPAAALGKRPPSPLAHLPRSEVSIVTAAGTHRFKVWIAADAESRSRGLMFVRQLPADQGMLFLFPRAHDAAFWMKNTYLSLDIVFIRADGTVANVARDATPLSEDPIQSSAPVTAVLEVLAGTAARIGIASGDRVVLPGGIRISERDAGGGQRVQ